MYMLHLFSALRVNICEWTFGAEWKAANLELRFGTERKVLKVLCHISSSPSV